MPNVQSSEEDNTEHVLDCNLGDTKVNLNDKKGKEWREMAKIYRKSTKKMINR